MGMESLREELSRANQAIILLGETIDQMVDNCILMETQIRCLERLLMDKGIANKYDAKIMNRELAEVRGQLENEKKKDS